MSGPRRKAQQLPPPCFVTHRDLPCRQLAVVPERSPFRLAAANFTDGHPASAQQRCALCHAAPENTAPPTTFATASLDRQPPRLSSHSTTTHHPAGWLGPSRRVCHTPNDAGVQSNSRVWGRRETPGPHRAGRPKPSSRLPQWRGVLGHRGSDCTGKWHGPELCLGGPTTTTAARSGPCTGRRAAEGGTVWCRSPPSKSASRRPAVLARQVSADREN